MKIDLDWMSQANCQGLDPDLFFPPRGDRAALAEALAVCRGCEVRAECLEYALSLREDGGIWGRHRAARAPADAPLSEGVVTEADWEALPRFFAFVKVGPTARHPSLGRCWIWTGGTTPDGYGVFSVAGRSVRAHRWAHLQMVGPIPEGLDLDHFACDRPGCVNPQHTRPVTVRENNLRSDCVSARAAAATACPSGHPYDSANTYHWRGIRYCRACRAERARRRRARSAA